MRIRLSIMLVIMLSVAFQANTVTRPDPSDYTLVAYKLSAAQENSFNNTDRVESPFWPVLINHTTQIDYLYLTPVNNARAGATFESNDDAQMSVWAAWGVNGLYLYFKVRDDNWVDYGVVFDGEGANDAVDFFLDGEHSSNALYADPTLFYNMRWTMTMVHYQWRFGGTEAPTTFRFNQLDPAWDPTSGTLSSSIKHASLSIAEGEARGIFMEPFGTVDYIHRIQELLIPWEHVSYNGIALPAVGSKIAAVFGYNDVDGDMTGGVNELRWRLSDPYSNEDCWADIEFGPLIADVGVTATELAAPVLVSPVNNASVTAPSTTVSFGAISNATTYVLQVSTSSNFSTFLVNTSGLTTTSFMVTGLQTNAVYYWRVHAANATISALWNWSETRQFSTTPIPPLITYPRQSMLCSTRVAMVSNVPANSGGVIAAYSITPALPAGFIFNISNGTIAGTPATESSAVAYIITATNSSGNAKDTIQITVVTGPFPPAITYPQQTMNCTTGVAVVANIPANSGSGAVSYSVNTTMPAGLSFNSINGTISGIPTTTSSSMAYSISATNAAGTGRDTVMIAVYPPLGAPMLQAPASGSTGITTNPTLRFWSVIGAASYRVQLSRASNFNTIVFDTIMQAPDTVALLLSLLNNTTYYWRVNASKPNNGGTSNWSTTFNFTTIVAPPGTFPVTVSPPNGAVNIPLSTTLRWHPVAGTGTIRYRVQISTVIDFSTLLKDSTGIADTNLTIAGLSKSTTYFWSVSALNAGGDGDWSTTTQFRTIIDLPQTVMLLTPSDMTTVQADSVRLVWAKGAPEITRYLLEVATDTTMTRFMIRDSTRSDTSRMMPLSPGVTYSWRVKACNATGWGAYSRKFIFTNSTTATLPTGFQIKNFSLNGTSHRISYALPNRCKVTLAYYDLGGRLLEMPVDLMQDAGNYSVNVPVEKWAKGTYLQIFKAGKFEKKALTNSVP